MASALYDYQTNEQIRVATKEEVERSKKNHGAFDVGMGKRIIEVDGRDCYIVENEIAFWL